MAAKRNTRQKMKSPYVSVSDNFVLDFSVSKAVARSAPKNATLEGILLYKFPTTVVEETFKASWDVAQQYYHVVSRSISVAIGDNEKINVTYNGKVYTLYNDVSQSHLMKPNKKTVIESGICTKNDIYSTDVDTKALTTLSGGYNGSGFIFSSADADSEQEALVGGKIFINGVGTVDATFSFKSVRYAEGSFFEEHLQILSSVGALVAEALYVDYGTGFTSTADSADFLVHTSFGELRNTKGHYIRITFNNTTPCKPRTISFVPGFGPDTKNAIL